MNTTMKKDDLVMAFDVVSQLARDGVLEDDCPDMEYEAGRQKAAVDMFDDFTRNNFEAIEDFFWSRGGAASLKGEAGEIPELDLDEVRGVSQDPHLDMMSITLELAAQRFRDGHLEDTAEVEIEGEVMLASHAVDLVGAFWERYGREIQEQFTNFVLPDDFFEPARPEV